MCAGNAIIATDSSGTSEVVGDAAILVPPQNPKAIADALEQLLASLDLVASLGRKACTRLEQDFSWEAVTRRY